MRSSDRPAVSLLVQLGKCRLSSWESILKIYEDCAEAKAVVPRELLPVFLDLAPLYTPGLRPGCGHPRALLHRRIGSLGRLRVFHYIRSCASGPLPGGYVRLDASIGIRTGPP